MVEHVDWNVDLKEGKFRVKNCAYLESLKLHHNKQTPGKFLNKHKRTNIKITPVFRCIYTGGKQGCLTVKFYNQRLYVVCTGKVFQSIWTLVG